MLLYISRNVLRNKTLREMWCPNHSLLIHKNRSRLKIIEERMYSFPILKMVRESTMSKA